MALTKITNSAIADDIGLGGNPTTSTQTAGDSTTRIATTAFVSTAVANLVDSAPETLNTLAELATSIGNNATLSSTLTTSIATKLPLAGGTLTGNLNLGDNVRARFGTDNDLQIYHDGSNAQLVNSTGALFTQGTVKHMAANGSDYMATFNSGGSVELYHNTSVKLATTATGIDVTGIATMDGLTVNVSADSDSVATITSSATANNTQLRLGTSGNDSVISGSGGSNGGLKFKVYGSEKMAISSAGNVTINGGNLDVTGNIGVSGTVDGIDIAARDAVLTSTTTTAGAALPKAGGTMTGALVMGASALTLNGSLGTWSVNAEGARMSFGRNSANYINATHESGYLVFQTSNGETALTLNSSQEATFTNKLSATEVNIGAGATNGSKLRVNGKIVAGDASSTGGDVLLEGYYGNGATAVIGSEYSSGGLFLGYGVHPSTTTQGQFLSSTTATLSQGAYVVSDTHKWYTVTGGSSVAVGSQLTTMAERMRIKSDGYVGIGTINPVYKLVISNSGAAGIEFGPEYAGDTNLVQHYDRTANAYMDVNNIAQNHRFGRGSSEWMRITNLGNVGIGDDNPSDKFVVKGDAASIGVESADMQVALLGKRSSSGVGLDQGYLRLRNQGVTADGAVVDSAGPSFFNGGSVGIGTSSPNTQLQINSATDPKIRLESNESGSKRLELWIDGGEAIGYIAADQSASQLAFKTAGTERMRIDSSGDVGIGTISPGHKLDVEGGSNVFDIARFGSSASDNSEVTIGYFDANANNGIPALITASDFGGLIQGGEHGHLVLGIRDNDATDALDIVSGGGNFMSDSTYDTLVATFKANGNVGIGITDPDQALEIGAGGKLKLSRADNSRSMLLYTNNADCVIQSDTDPLHLQSANRMTFATNGASERMRIDTSGKVGIGTPAPTHGLTVSDDTGGDDANFRRITIKSATHGVNSGFRFDSESANGTARGGGYYFQPGDTDATTYLGLTASDSAYQMVVTRDGNVAIGTTEVANANSSLTIDVNQSSNNARGLHFYGGADVTNKYISIGRTHTAGNQYINSEVRFGAEVGGQGQSFLSFATGTANPNETTGNPERMRITSAGNVGIGTASPNAYSNQIALTINGTTHSRVDLEVGGVLKGNIHVDSGSINVDAGANKVRFNAGNTERARISSTGRLHINHTNDPGWDSLGTLVVKQIGNDYGIGVVDVNSQNTFKMLNNETYAELNYNVNLPIIFTTGTGAGTERMRIHTGGNVGIGAAAPSEKLEVDGGIKISNSNSRLYFGAEGGTSYRALEGNTGGSLLQVGEGYSSIALQGKVAINTTTTYDAALRVVGATSTVNGHGDLASISTETGSVVSSGSIKHEIGYSGTYSSGKTWTWTYAATSWKSFHVSLKVASTAGFSSYEGGGYNNNGGPMNTVEHGNDLGSLVITRSGQQMIMTYTTNTTHIHPFFELTYRQSGGDGSPRMDRLSLVQT